MIRGLLLGAMLPIWLVMLWIGFVKIPLVMALMVVLFLVMAFMTPPQTFRRRPRPDDPAMLVAIANAAAAREAARERAAAASRFGMVRPPKLRPEQLHPDTITEPLPSRLAWRLPKSFHWQSPRYRVGPPAEPGDGE